MPSRCLWSLLVSQSTTVVVFTPSTVHMATATMWTTRSEMLARAEATLESDYSGWRAESPSSWPEPSSRTGAPPLSSEEDDADDYD